MPIGLFGKKIGMTHIFDDSGSILPVTLVKAEECQVSQIKTINTDGYNAIQVAYRKTLPSKISKPLLGHLKKSGDNVFQSFNEFRVDNLQNFKLGQIIDLSSCEVGKKVSVVGKSIGKGFAGNQKRNNFARGPMTHGSKNHRLPGSVGAGTTPGRVFPGKKMAGQLGYQTTTKNSEILFINNEEQILVLKGSLPGKQNSVLKILFKD